MTKISICIPTYNGEKELPQLLESLIPQIQSEVEIIFSDDQSTDKTYDFLQEYAQKYPFIRVFKNQKNLGMDRNFTQSVLYAKSEYVWLCGQDDIFNPGAIEKFFEIIKQYPDVNFIYFNYNFLNGDLTTSSNIKAPLQNFEHDLYFKTAPEYFKQIDHAPTFLPAIIMRRKYWDLTDYKQFFNTHYVQVGVWLDNFNEGNVYVVTNPKYITGRVPEDSWKINSGQMIFEIFSGNQEIYKRIYESDHNCLSQDFYLKKQKEYFKNFIGQIIWIKSKGLELKPVLKKRMKYLFDKEPIKYWFFVRPLFYMPKSIANFLSLMGTISFIKAIFKKILSFIHNS